MAIVKKNLVTKGLSGKLGDDLVFKQQNGKTVLASAPKRRTGEASTAQEKQKDRFRSATQFARAQIVHPEIKEKYKKKGKKRGISAYNMAVADYFHAPEIGGLTASNYHGEVGDALDIVAFDDFKVEHVEVEIYHKDGNLVEKGLASKNGNDTEWHYAATVANAEYSGDKIVVKAFDYPGNETDKEFELA